MSKIFERVYLDNPEIAPQTKRHHLARYEFATSLKKNEGVAFDLACGSGYGTEMLRSAGYEAVGVDRDEQAINYAKEHFPKCVFRVHDFLSPLPLTLSTMDLVVLFEAIEHLPFSAGQELLKRIRTFVKEEGIFIMSTPRDVNDKYNTFHLSEWPYFLIKNTLGSLYSFVQIYGQDWSTGEISQENVRENDFYIAVCHP